MHTNELLTVEELTPAAILRLLDRAEQFSKANEREYLSLFAGKTMVPLFYEPSTRTRCSFEIAAKRLGMDVIYFDTDVSSVTKGESLWDTIRTLEAMGVDVAVLRHQHDDVYDALRGRLHMGLVNAGNGVLAHPTQGLLDWLTMRKVFGQLQGLTVAIVGDVKHSRVARSNIVGLKKLGANPIVSGPDAFRDPRLEQDAPYVPFEEALREADVVMMLRIQRERLEADIQWELDDYMWQHGLTVNRLELMKSHAIVMHPGPINRGIEIDGELIENERSRIQTQVRNGVFVRMAVIEYVLGGGDKDECAHSTSDVLSIT